MKRFSTLALGVALAASVAGRSHADPLKCFSGLPENIAIKYHCDPIGTPANVPEQFQKHLVSHRPRYCSIIKQGDRVRIETRWNEKDLAPDRVFCYDGTNFYEFQQSRKLLTVGSKEDAFQKELRTHLYMSPVHFYSYLQLSENDEERIKSEFTKPGDLTSLIMQGPPLTSGVPVWYDFSWKGKPDTSVGNLIRNEIVVKFFASDVYRDKGDFDPINSRKIVITEVSLANSEFPQEYFVIPLSSAQAVIDYDLDGNWHSIK